MFMFYESDYIMDVEKETDSEEYDKVIEQILTSFGNNEARKKIIKEIKNEGVCWNGANIRHKKNAMSFSISSWAAAEDEIENSIKAIINNSKKI